MLFDDITLKHDVSNLKQEVSTPPSPIFVFEFN